ncbi:hypothetical protein PAECIP111893_00833 [Paenibacillus plantiphilus]|uniref:Uncharacterized protein n=1 Tax=Paenibacillus plantiphilus TaxID=2905650 RepID=A0ABM9BYR1_9BACL|nr:hypothetical protein [Paenibacillus plantiphilus]CAH1197587.1 hypothetical protein PAECIP111893_00833 [Paenibacillus plantiphilus]
MTKQELLLHRLDAIGQTLEKKGEVLMLLGLGSVGIETERLDEYSDLDFFVIAKPGHAQRFIDQLDWLEDTYPLAYAFKNSDFGCKILFQDGIYGEYAVFEESDMETAGYSEGRIVWKAPSFNNLDIVKPKIKLPELKTKTMDFAINEALTNLYVGLGRYARGEKLSGTRFVEGYAVDNIIAIMHMLQPEVDYYPDCFGNDRRFEKRFPLTEDMLGNMIQGYKKVPQSAIYILNYLEKIYPINERMSAEIRALAAQLETQQQKQQ